MTDLLMRERLPLPGLRDRNGGLWLREILVQGKVVDTHVVQGQPVQ
jgi:hypothetical protein